MKLFVFFLSIFIATPLAAQEKPKFGAQKPEPKAEEHDWKRHRRHAEKRAEQKPEPRAGMAQKKGSDNVRFGSTVDQTEIERAKKAAEKRR